MSQVVRRPHPLPHLHLHRNLLLELVLFVAKYSWKLVFGRFLVLSSLKRCFNSVSFFDVFEFLKLIGTFNFFAGCFASRKSEAISLKNPSEQRDHCLPKSNEQTERDRRWCMWCVLHVFHKLCLTLQERARETEPLFVIKKKMVWWRVEATLLARQRHHQQQQQQRSQPEAFAWAATPLLSPPFQVGRFELSLSLSHEHTHRFKALFLFRSRALTGARTDLKLRKMLPSTSVHVSYIESSGVTIHFSWTKVVGTLESVQLNALASGERFTFVVKPKKVWFSNVLLKWIFKRLFFLSVKDFFFQSVQNDFFQKWFQHHHEAQVIRFQETTQQED